MEANQSSDTSNESKRQSNNAMAGYLNLENYFFLLNLK